MMVLKKREKKNVFLPFSLQDIRNGRFGKLGINKTEERWSYTYIVTEEKIAVCHTYTSPLESTIGRPGEVSIFKFAFSDSFTTHQTRENTTKIQLP